MGSCINKEFIEKNGLQIKKLPVKLPVYNADGTLNKGGAIEGFVDFRMKISDHTKRIELAVTNLGKTSIFLALDWLQYHNPTINWTKSMLTFNQCPDCCGYLPKYDSLEDEGKDVEEKLEEGEQLFWMDWDNYHKSSEKLRSQQPSSAAAPYIKEFSDVQQGRL